MSAISSRRSSIVLALSLFVLLLPALQPLLTADPTCGYDNAFHLWRAVELEHLLRQSILFSRWAPNMAQGYGYPLFNFAAPASAYATALLRLLGLKWSWALNMTFAIGWALSAYTMYIFVGDIFDRHAGLVAATLYSYAPFHAYDAFYRGGLSQSSAWLFPPLILWALRRADRRTGFATAALGLAGLVLTHNAFALLFAPLLAAYLLVVGYQESKKTALWGGTALLVGLGLSAFFWLPALIDLGFVHSERLSGAWVFEYTNNFLPLKQLLAPPRPADPTLINDWPARGLGAIPALLALIGVVALRDRQSRPQVAFFAAALASCLFLILPMSQPVWDALPLLQRVQFPWRLAGPATLCAAVLAGGAASLGMGTRSHSAPVGMELRPNADLRSLLIPAALILLIVFAHLGWFYPRHCPLQENISVAEMTAWERATDTLGTTAKGEYLPAWVHRMPNVPALDSAHTAEDSIVRLLPETLPEGAQIIRADYGPLDAVIELETPIPFQARYLAFYYPGWQVQVDGNDVPVAPTDPEGLTSFEVPAGRHLVHVRFGETLLRLTADVTSLLSAAALAAILAFTLRPAAPPAPNIRRPIANLLFPALALVVLITKVAILDRVETPLRRTNLVDGRLRDVDVPAEITFGDEFLLLGHDALPEHVPSGGQIEVTTYWRALQPGGPDYGVTVNVVDARGHRWNSADIRPSRWHRTPPRVGEWPPDQYAIIVLSVPILPGTPPGTYTVEAVAFDHGTLSPLTAHDADGGAIGPALALGQIFVNAPPHPADLDALGLRQRLDASLGPLTLLGADFDRDRAAPGDPILLTTCWRADQQPPENADLTLHLALLGPDGSIAEEFDLPPTTAWHPTSLWEAGDVWRGQHLLHLPADLDDGDHTWHLALRLGQRPISPAMHLPNTLTITAPDRTFAPPPVDVETSTRLGDTATLVGANFQPSIINLQPGATLTTTLVWRAEGETRTSYHVFVHLLGPDGTLVAQSDGIPAGWTRPTTSWLPGEYVTDVHVLGLPAATPPGDYTLLAGLYVPGGERVTTPDGADAIPLAAIPVGSQ